MYYVSSYYKSRNFWRITGLILEHVSLKLPVNAQRRALALDLNIFDQFSRFSVTVSPRHQPADVPTTALPRNLLWLHRRSTSAVAYSAGTRPVKRMRIRRVRIG